MIKAHFEWNRLYINISEMEQKYKENWKKIKFIVYYGVECTISSWLESYSKQMGKEIEYFWEDEIILELDEVENWYRWNSIFVWYYIEVNFWKKFLLFKDSKEIEISWRENQVYYKKNLPINWKYNYNKDTYSYKKIIKNISKIRKIILLLAFLLFISWIYLHFLQVNDLWIIMLVIWLVTLLITFFTAWRWYFSWKIKKEINESDELSNIISWKIKNNLEKLKIQIYATNSERWEYEVSSGSTTRIVSFNKTVWNILLFEKVFLNVKSWTNIETLIKWNINFDEIYSNLFPEIKINPDYGLFLNLELRIISKNFKDIIYKTKLSLDENKFISKKWNIIKNNNNLSNQNNKIKSNNEVPENLNSDFFD